ncbi:MAG: phosphopentomutase [bacterium]
MRRRVLLIVLDGVGIGALPDAGAYGDDGANTLAHALQTAGHYSLPFFTMCGLGRLLPDSLLPFVSAPLASWGILQEVSAGKDTVVGHWEMMGAPTLDPFPTFPRGFPPDLILSFEGAINRKTLGNIAASGTEIIEQLGREHLRTGFPIVYTSADSVFQIAAHEKIIPLEELYRYCRLARAMLTGPNAVARVIARPFNGEPGHFERTAGRQDYPLPPPGTTVLDILTAHRIAVTALGKIVDIFVGRGITQFNHTPHNAETMKALEGWLAAKEPGFCFVNFGDFDMLWGHRRLPREFVHSLEEVDKGLGNIAQRLKEDDLLIITADHGNDPTFLAHTDHTREQVPVLVYSPGKSGHNLGVRPSLADAGATVLAAFQLPISIPGQPLI